jgi:rubrerythrin
VSAADIPDLPHFLAHAYAMETEAAERYRLLSNQMEVHNNPEVAELFTRLAEIEAKHAEEILSRAGKKGLPNIAFWDFGWTDAEGPETAVMENAHYLMTPHHVLTIALDGEQRAFEFFDRVAREAGDADMRSIAEEFAEEEREHIDMVRAMLDKMPEPDADWDEDMDPPVSLE